MKKVPLKKEDCKGMNRDEITSLMAKIVNEREGEVDILIEEHLWLFLWDAFYPTFIAFRSRFYVKFLEKRLRSLLPNREIIICVDPPKIKVR